MSGTPDPPAVRQRTILVTGPSGAGRSTAIDTLEDLGYEAIDNLPLSLLPRLLSGPAHSAPLALGIDTRNREFTTTALLASIQDLASRAPLDFDVLYLECSDDVLLRRFSETRRRHPMAGGDNPLNGISVERALLGDVRDLADVLIDTSELSVHELRAEVTRLFALDPSVQLTVSLHSFSYKRGLPRSADMVFDCRFLQNPHWVETLRPLTGLDASVTAYVEADARYAPFFQSIRDLCSRLLPAYKEEGKSHFSIALGCTGGRHRSVAVTEALGLALAQEGWQVSVRHRELEREGLLRAHGFVDGQKAADL